MNRRNTWMLIDDDADDGELFDAALADVAPELQSEIARNGAEALRRLQHPPYPSVIFIDMNMPIMDGPAVFDAMRQMEHLAGTAVYMYSTTGKGASIEKLKEKGVAGFLIKPSTYAELVTLLAGIHRQQSVAL